MTIRVNGEIVPEEAVLAEMKRLMDFYSKHLTREELGRQWADLLRKAKDHAIGTKLLLEEVRRRHIDVPAPEVDAALRDMIRKAGGEQALEDLLGAQHLTIEQLRGSIKAGKQLDLLIARIVASEPEPSEEEMRAYYEEHPARYGAPDQANVRHILIKPASADADDTAATRSRLLDLKRQIEEGADFADMAALHSECASGKEAGGNLGWIARGMAIPEFDAAVFDMEVGELSDVLETPLGFHIVEKLDQEEGQPQAFEQVRDAILELLVHERRGGAITRFVDKLRETAVIDEDETGDASGEFDKILDSFLDAQKDR